jgi:hypothetical protein
MGTPRQIRDKVSSKQRRDRNKKLMIDAMTPCVKCGFFHPSAMDFHHIDPKEKDKGVSELVRNGYATKRIVEELEKCICLCSNCHRILHSKGD